MLLWKKRIHPYVLPMTILLLLMILSPYSAFAATVSGKITETDHQTPIPGIGIGLEDAQTYEILDMTTTDDQGLFSFNGIRDGRYNIRIFENYPIKPFPFFLPSQFPTIDTAASSTTPINLILPRRVTSNLSLSSDAPFQPSYSAQYDSIAFYGYKDLASATPTDYDIYYMSEIQKPIKVVADPSNDFDPDLSPDGKRIVFVSDRNNGQNRNDLNLYIINVDGTDLVQLTDDPRDEFNPQWSPDGKHIAFITTVNDGNGGLLNNLLVIEADGTNFDQLTTSTSGQIDFQWSPDSSQIVISSNRVVQDGTNDYDLYLVNVATHQTVPLTTKSPDEFDPIWSPTGDSIIFSSYRFSPSLDTTTWTYTSQGGTPVLRSQEITSPELPGLLVDPSLLNVWKLDLASRQGTQITSHVNGSYNARYTPDFTVFNLGAGWDFFNSETPIATTLKQLQRAKALKSPALAEWNGIYYNWWTEVPWDWVNEHLIAGPTRSIENKQIRRFTNNSCLPMNVGSIEWKTTWEAGVTGNVGYGDFIGISVTGSVKEEETVTLGPWVVPPAKPWSSNGPQSWRRPPTLERLSSEPSYVLELP